MDKLPVVIIASSIGWSIHNHFEQIRYSLDMRYHAYEPHFKEMHISEREYGELSYYAAYAEHYGDK